jgi:S1-C subfamily serine protease
MNLLDVALILAIVLGALGGFRYGLIARLAGWFGLLVGLGLALWTVPTVLDLVYSGAPGLRFLVGVLVLSLTVAITSALFQRLGFGMRRAVHATPLRVVDRGAGLLGGIAIIGVLVWVLLPAAAYVPGELATQVRGSTVVQAVERVAPPSPDTVGAFSQLIDLQRFPDVFDDLRPAPDTGPPPSEIPVSSEVVEQATESTVKIDARGCRTGYVGSGWVVGDDLVVTNAHVIAGSDQIEVRRTDGEILTAEPVRFDPNRDLAVLRVAGLGRPALPMGEVEPDGDGAAIGYPGGQDQPRVAPATTREQRRTVGRDIYGSSRAERDVVYLAASLQRGDSGAPVINPDGEVVGVVFAISPDRSTTAYALSPAEVREVLDGPEANGTDRCM